MATAVAVPLMGDDSRAQEHLHRYNSLVQLLSLWLPTWQEITELGMPRKANVNLRRSPGSPQTERQLDSTMTHAGELLAASMQGALTSGSITWFYFRVRGLVTGTDQEADKYLDDAGEAAYDEIRQSNFSSQAHEFYADLGMIGTAAMFMSRKDSLPGKPWNGIEFKTLAPGSYVASEDASGRVDTVYYKFKLSSRAAVTRWDPGFFEGNSNGRLPERVYKDMESPKSADTEREYVHGVFPRNDPWLTRKLRVIAPKKRPWASLWMSVDEPKIVEEGGYYKFPYAVARWTKASGETYGRGPGYTALPDAKTLNKLIELKLRALANMVYPPLKVRDAGVIGTVRLAPGALTHVRDMDAVEPLKLAAAIDTAVMEIKALQEQIRRVFFADQLQLQEGPQMTAYEVQVRYELMQRILGPTLGRLETEFLEPVVEWVYDTMDRAKRFGDMPSSLIEFVNKNGGRLDIEYEGPLQRAQRLANVVTIQRFSQLVLPLVEADPEIMDNWDLDETMLIAAKDTGVPKKIIRSTEARDKRRADRRAAQAKQAEQQNQIESAKAAGAAAPALKAFGEAAKSGILPAGGLSGQGVPPGGIA
jgi:hypothetical protein